MQASERTACRVCVKEQVCDGDGESGGKGRPGCHRGPGSLATLHTPQWMPIGAVKRRNMGGNETAVRVGVCVRMHMYVCIPFMQELFNNSKE